jgi:hypothetical protein
MRGRTPDFKLVQDGKIRGYCELKSPRDDWVFSFPHDLKPGEHRAEVRRDMAAHNLAGHILEAAEQFDSINPEHKLPNILVIVSHARHRGPIDLRDVLEGIRLGDDGKRVFPPLADVREKEPDKQMKKQEKVWKAARSIDLYVWIDEHKRTCEYRFPVGAERLKEACDLLGLEPWRLLAV